MACPAPSCCLMAISFAADLQLSMTLHCSRRLQRMLLFEMQAVELESLGEQAVYKIQAAVEPGVASVDDWAGHYNFQSGRHRGCPGTLPGFERRTCLHVPVAVAEGVEVMADPEKPDRTSKPLRVALGDLSVSGTD